MKTYGKLRLQDGFWIFATPPNIRMKLKQVFPRVDKGSFVNVRIKVTAETCRDVEWFLQRFPMDVDAETLKRIKKGSSEHRQRVESLEEVMAPGHRPRSFDLAKPLREYQARAVEVHAANRGLLVADELGLGKTVTAIGTLTDKAMLPALVVCPVHLCRQWKDQLGVFLPLLNTHIVKRGPQAGVKGYKIPESDVVICSYSKLAAWGDHFSDGLFHSSIFDEVQEVRRNESQKYKAAAAVSRSVGARMGLSATPIYNYGGEIFNILEVVAPGRVGERQEFYREWCSFHGNDQWVINDPSAFGQYLRDEFLMLRRTRGDVGLELPQVERPTITIPHDPDVLKKIEGDALELARMVLAGSFEESGEAAREFDLKMRMATGVAKAPFVADFVRMIVENGEKVLLFGWHREVYDVWMERLKDLNPVLYTGSESATGKTESVNRFLYGDSQVLIMSLRSGVGVDGLQKFCHTAVFGELDWSPGVHEQCIGRLNRDGVGRGVLAYFLISEAGSDPVVAGILGLKKAQHGGIVDLADGEEPEGNPLAGQNTGGRITELAKDFLTRKGQAIPERQKADKTEVLL